MAKRRTQAERRGESDRALMLAGVRLIAQKGIHRTSLAEVGEASGYSRALPNERYGGKMNFVLAVVDFVITEFEEKVAARARGKQGLAALQARLTQHFAATSGPEERARVMYVLFTESWLSQPELAGKVQEFDSAIFDGYLTCLLEAKAAGEIPADSDCMRIAATVHALVRGFLHSHLVIGRSRMGADYSPDDWGNEVVSMALNAQGPAK